MPEKFQQIQNWNHFISSLNLQTNVEDYASLLSLKVKFNVKKQIAICQSAKNPRSTVPDFSPHPQNSIHKILTAIFARSWDFEKTFQ